MAEIINPLEYFAEAQKSQVLAILGQSEDYLKSFIETCIAGVGSWTYQSNIFDQYPFNIAIPTILSDLEMQGFTYSDLQVREMLRRLATHVLKGNINSEVRRMNPGQIQNLIMQTAGEKNVFKNNEIPIPGNKLRLAAQLGKDMNGYPFWLSYVYRYCTTESPRDESFTYGGDPNLKKSFRGLNLPVPYAEFFLEQFSFLCNDLNIHLVGLQGQAAKLDYRPLEGGFVRVDSTRRRQ